MSFCVDNPIFSADKTVISQANFLYQTGIMGLSVSKTIKIYINLPKARYINKAKTAPPKSRTVSYLTVLKDVFQWIPESIFPFTSLDTV